MDKELFSKIVKAVIRAESSGNPNAVSGAGALGLMQVMPNTAKEICEDLGIEDYDPFNPEQNELVGSTYLKRMLILFGELRLALAAYNYGPGNVSKLCHKFGDRYIFIEMSLPNETKNYVNRIVKDLNDQGIIT